MLRHDYFASIINIYNIGVNFQTYSTIFFDDLYRSWLYRDKKKKKKEKEEKIKKIDKKRLIRKRERGRGKKKDINAEDVDNNKEDNKIYEIYVYMCIGEYEN